MIDIAREAKKQGLRPVLISCGIMNEAPLAELCEALDAIKIDLKGYDEAFYRDVCGAELRPVLRSIKQIAKSRAHLEIVNLVVPTLNDSEKMLRGLIDWVLGEVGPDVPVHFTRFHPDYQLRNLPPTPVATLERAGRRRWGGGCITPMSETSRTIRGTIPTALPAGRRSSGAPDFSSWKCMSKTAAAASAAGRSPASGVERRSIMTFCNSVFPSSLSSLGLAATGMAGKEGGRGPPPRRGRAVLSRIGGRPEARHRKIHGGRAAAAGEKTARHRRPPCRVHLLRPDLRRRLEPGPRRGL